MNFCTLRVINSIVEGKHIPSSGKETVMTKIKLMDKGLQKKLLHMSGF